MAGVFLSAALIGLAGCSDRPEQGATSETSASGVAATRPHIILITIDTLRADRVGVYGNNAGLTPNINRLAESGTVFDHAIAPMGTTWPTHTSMFTGLYPRYHGVRRNGHALAGGVSSVAELLSNAGFQTGSFISFRAMHHVGGLDRGFAAASDAQRPSGKTDPIRDGRDVTDLALEWLSEQAGDAHPVMMWMHLFEPHGPYDLTAYSREWMTRTGYRGLLRDGASMELLHQRTREITGSADELEALNVLYDGEVRLADAYVGETLDRLAELEMLDRSIVIVTSDHGQALGEDGRMGHGPVLWEEVLHVPLVVRDFRRDRQPDRISQTVGLADLAPTMVDYALGLQLPGVHGRSLVGALAGQTLPEREIFAEVALKASPGAWYDADALAVYVDGLKFVRHKQSISAYDPAGPASTDRALDHVDGIEALEQFVESAALEFLAGEVAPNPAELTDDDIEALRSLGYIQ
ncbi:MAG: sulfatase [Xanthomonadaceae bacterium]|nr:sulfatase [Xanthomonadaceae bacterium]